MYWYTPLLMFDDSPQSYQIFNSKSYIWASLIEREFRKTINTYWRPINEKVQSLERSFNFLQKIESELNQYKQEINFLNKSHEYKRQEILIPHNHTGVITIVQGLQCGEKLDILDSLRTISIPKNGNLILNNRYISYNHEYSLKSERHKTSAFRVNGNERIPLTILTEKGDQNDFGLSVIGQFNKHIESRKYNIVVMYVGLRKDAQLAYEQGEFYNKQLPQILEKCK